MSPAATHATRNWPPCSTRCCRTRTGAKACSVGWSNLCVPLKLPAGALRPPRLLPRGSTSSPWSAARIDAMSFASPNAGPMSPGFADPVFDSQRMFRRLLEAMNYPGRIVDAGLHASAPAPLASAAAAVCLSLADYETPVWLDAAAQPVRDWLRFHCGCPIVADPGQARFGIVADAAAIP